MDSSAFAHETTLTVRFRDLDPMEQVHNSVVLQYVEEARIRYFRDVLGEELTEMNGAIARQEVDYQDLITLDSSVTVRYRVSEIGESSLTMQFEVRADDAVAARGDVVHVVLDETDSPTSVPTAWVDRIQSFEETPVTVR